MTPLRKRVQRRTESVFRGRRIVVSLHPGDVLGFREERTHTEYFLTISGAYVYAVRCAVAQRQLEKMKARKGRR